MPQFKLLVNEKSILVSKDNYYILELVSKNSVNKIEIKKLLKKVDINATKVNTLKPFAKTKSRGKKQNKIEVARNPKFFVQLKIGQKLDEEIVNKLNELK
jgi:hypothetical protein